METRDSLYRQLIKMPEDTVVSVQPFLALQDQVWFPFEEIKKLSKREKEQGGDHSDDDTITAKFLKDPELMSTRSPSRTPS